MAEFKISRLRYTWKGAWSENTGYNRDDVINYGGSTWACIRQHTATDFNLDQEYKTEITDTEVQPAWEKIADGYKFKGNWTASTDYDVNDIVKYAGGLYLVVTAYNSSSTFDDDLEYLSSYLEFNNFRGEWSELTRYGTGDTVSYNGNVYVCVLGHTSSTDEDGIEVGTNDDLDDSTGETWQLLFQGVKYRGAYASQTIYRLNDLVLYLGSILKCTQSFISTTTFDPTKWTVLLGGSEFSQDWNASAIYGYGSVVRYGGFLFYSLRPNSNSAPIDSIYQLGNNTPDWEILSKGVNFRGDWAANTVYKTGDVVRRGGNLYVSLTGNVADGSSLDYLDTSNWEILNSTHNWRGPWNSNRTYSLGDIVIFLGDVYEATLEHVSNNDNFPGDNGSGFDYWEILIQAAGPTVGMRQIGDLLTYGLSRSLAGDGSTLGATSVPIGTLGQVVSVDTDRTVTYRDFGTVSRVVYVSTDGVDDTSLHRGLSADFPYRTIRYAAKQLDDGYSGFSTISVGVGLFEELLPIIVPKKTVVLGSELRSTTIRAAEPSDPVISSTYLLSILTRLSSMMPSLIEGSELNPSKSLSNSLDVVDPIGPVDLTAPDDVQNKIDDIKQYINFHINDLGDDVTVYGTNTAITNVNYVTAIETLQANKEFLQAEAVAYMQDSYPSVSFNTAGLETLIGDIVESIVYDLRYPGNYKSILEARWYSNIILGSDHEDMFYMRDATGLRDCTLKGLTGILNPPTIFDLYRRPTGGSFVSLDPGWGPNDDRCWILTRSPYIQGVTTFGTACVGQKIDGALHNGGNRSMVSNDFTQVLSDGVGAWVTNNGLAELVSVFTYYCAIGYLAESGGKIRGTNGNNSYGRYGSVSDGVDETETPQTVVVNNRNQQATIQEALAGNSADDIQALFFRNAGQNYTQAAASFTGAGINANVVFEDFRDNAIFETRLLDTSTSTTSIVGGTGYSVSENNAQPHSTPGGDLIGITIASNDTALEEDYVSKRIVIVGGTGTGQYAKITAFNTTSKVVSVVRESDGVAGWDHFIAGTPAAPILDTTTRYRIEPQITIPHPGFSSLTTNSGVTTTWGSLVYGEITASFTNIVGDAGTDQPEAPLVPVTARFNVSQAGRSYTVTITNAGAGYAAGDIIVLEGTNFGGVSPANDITIEVLDVTDDSTNSISQFQYSGTAPSGKFVALTSSGTAGVYSSDGEDWNSFNLPSSGNWSVLLSGQNKFIAIRNGSNVGARSSNGTTWTAFTMPENRLWTAGVYGGDRFVVVAADQNTSAYSDDGITWATSSLPTVGDSTVNEWIDITYGKGKYVALANSQNAIAYSEDGETWTGGTIEIQDSTQLDWVSIAYGDNRWVALSSQGVVAYTFDLETWYTATMPTQDGSTAHNWVQMRYGQGVFFAIGNTGSRDVGGDPTTGETTFCATSEDGAVWTGRTLTDARDWSNICFGNPYIQSDDSSVTLSTPLWILTSDGTSSFNRVRTGCTAKARASVSSGKISRISLWDTGSGYLEPPTVTIVDPSETSPAAVECRLADGVLSQPSWINRGLGYRTSSTVVTITGNGFADVIPVGKFVTVEGLDFYPGAGSQITFAGYSQIYVIITEEQLGNIGNGLAALYRVAPELKVRDKLEHGNSGSIQINYSQVRITGHDFLDIGTGNFEDTNYPEIYSTGLFTTAPENEVYEENGGRVFYTSTDQSGNFRAGELFAVEQATGIVTISADFFDLSGLSELRLGGIRIGGSGVVVREFSTDALFTADSNNIIPTQRAIAAYLANRLTLGGSEIATASFIAGQVRVGPDYIASTVDDTVYIRQLADFDASGTDVAAISGTMLAQAFFKKSFRRSV
jgi:hypothetical protein